MSDVNAVCLVCERNSDQIPLLAFQYRSKALWICPEHLPILIHHPDQLADRLAVAAADPDTHD